MQLDHAQVTKLTKILHVDISSSLAGATIQLKPMVESLISCAKSWRRRSDVITHNSDALGSAARQGSADTKRCAALIVENTILWKILPSASAATDQVACATVIAISVAYCTN
jgi:hypothetical protein